MENLKIEVDSDGIALVLFDSPGKSMNTVGFKATQELAELAQRFKTDDAIKGVVCASGKPSGFCAGADLNEMLATKEGIAVGVNATAMPSAFRASAALRDSWSVIPAPIRVAVSLAEERSVLEPPSGKVSLAS